MKPIMSFDEFMDNEIENIMQSILDENRELPDLNSNYREFFLEKGEA